MRTFAQVSEEGSFAGAARRMSLNQAVVTRLVADLEAHLGARLLNRTTRSLSLTEAGERYLQRCRQILADIDEAEELVGDGTTSVGGRVRIAVPVLFGIHLFAPRLPKFRARYPGIVLDVALLDRPVDLVSEGFDVAIMPTIVGLPTSLIARSLGKKSFMLCAAPSYLEAAGVPTRPEDLLHHACIGYSLYPLREAWKLVDRQGHSASLAVNFVMQSNNLALVREAVQAGLGIGQQVDYSLDPEFARGRMVPVLTDWSVGNFELSIVYPSREHLHRRVRALIDFIIDERDAIVAQESCSTARTSAPELAQEGHPSPSPNARRHEVA